MPTTKNSQPAPGVANGYFDFTDEWRALTRILGGAESVLPSQFHNEPESQDLVEARKLGFAILRQSLMDLESCYDFKAGLRSKRNLQSFTNTEEIRAWFFDDSYFTEELIDNGELPIPETETPDSARFIEPSVTHRLSLERESDGTFSFRGCCHLLCLNAAGIRKKLRDWMDLREQGNYVPLVSDGIAAASRRRALMRIRQAEGWKRAGYPRDAIAAYYPARLAGPALPNLKPIPREARQRQINQVMAFAAAGMDKSAIALVLGLSDKRVKYILRPRASRAKAVNEALIAGG